MNTYTKKISEKEAEQIKKILSEDYNCSFDVVQYSVWRAKTAAFQAVYYTSGKLLIQGKDVVEIVSKIETIFGKNYDISPRLDDVSTMMADCSVYIGTDESGKGDFFGPLVIAGVQVSKDNKNLFSSLGIKDSKKLDDAKIKKLAVQIKNNSVNSVVVITPVKYNELYYKFNNLNKLLAWGHARAIENILEKNSCEYALADKFGDEKLIQNALMTKGRNITLKQSVRAESDIAVAAASVLARAEFVKRMEEMEEKYMMPFSKGASSKVIDQAKIFIQNYSFERLNEIAKMHFKTVNDLK